MDKFVSFLGSLKTGVNDILVESIGKAYNLIYESEVGGNIGLLNASKISRANAFSKDVIELVFADGSIYPMDSFKANRLFEYIKEEMPDLLESPYYLEDMVYTSADNFKKWLGDIGITA